MRRIDGSALHTIAGRIAEDLEALADCWEVVVESLPTTFADVAALSRVISALEEGLGYEIEDLDFDQNGGHITVSFLDAKQKCRADLLISQLKELERDAASQGASLEPPRSLPNG